MNIEFSKECSCSQCQDFCKHTPGTPTYLEAKQLIMSGYARKLMCNWESLEDEYIDKDWANKVKYSIDGKLFFLQPAIVPYFGLIAPETMIDGRCAFFINNKCSINHIKPFECRLEGCNSPYNEYEIDDIINIEILSTWDTEEAQDLVKFWKRKVNAS
jgi:Fe-S-cluster containining protein